MIKQHLFIACFFAVCYGVPVLAVWISAVRGGLRKKAEDDRLNDDFFKFMTKGYEHVARKANDRQ